MKLRTLISPILFFSALSPADEYQHELNFLYYDVVLQPSMQNDEILMTVRRGREAAGLGTDGNTNTDFGWSITETINISEDVCSISDIDLTAISLITLPRITQVTQAPVGWLDASNLLLRHELGHFANHGAALAELLILSKSFQFSCQSIEGEFGKRANKILSDHKRIDQDIDSAYSGLDVP